MAPWPEQGNEPKAPDRNKTTDNRTLDNLKSKSEPPEDKKPIKGNSKEDQSEAKKKDVHSLDDGQLKALLDEAIQYKNPKDREGKSKIFRELLQKVEADESDYSYPVVGIRGSGGRRAVRVKEGSRGITVSERASRGGSLQNIFHAASSSEFDTHHSGGARRKNKRQGPGSSVSARQREGGSLPSNVNSGWPLESWQSDQVRKKGLFDRDSQQQSSGPGSFGNTAYYSSSSVAAPSTQARRQTLKHSASNELPTSRKQSPGELYPLRRHHSSSDQLKSLELNIVKLKNQPESSSMVRKMPQLSKPSDSVSLDVGSLDLEMNKLGDSEPTSFEKKLQNIQNSDKYRITPCEVESKTPNNNSQEMFTSRASLEVEPVDSSIELDFGEKRVNLERVLEKRVWNGMESVQLSENYPSVQCIVGDGTRISDASNQGRMGEQSSGLRPHMYRNLNMNMISLVNISSKSATDSPRTDENGNALNMPSLTSRGLNSKKNHKKKLLAEKNVVFSQNIPGYRGYHDIDIILSFIESESDKVKNKQLKKTLTKAKKNEKKRQNMQKSSSLEEVSQRNIEGLTEGSESERTTGRKSRVGTPVDTSMRDRRWGDQGFVKSGSQNDLSMEQVDENNSDSEFQMVTKKQRKRKVIDNNPKRPRNHRNCRRSPRRKSTSSVPPSERSGESDLDSVHSLPVGGAPTVSYADIAAGNAGFFNSKGIGDTNSFDGNNPDKVESASDVKSNEIEEWCNSVSQHWEKSKVNNNNNNNNVNLNNRNNSNSSVGNNSSNNRNNGVNSNNINIHNNNNININHTNNNINSDLKNFSRHDNAKQNLDVDVNEICDNNVKKMKDLIIVDKTVEKSEVASDRGGDIYLKDDFKTITSSCDLDQCKVVEDKSNNDNKNWNKNSFSHEDFPSLPVKSENGNYLKSREISEQNTFARTKHYYSLPENTERQGDDTMAEPNPTKTLRRAKFEEDSRYRRSNRSRSVGPNARPPVILLHDEKIKDSSICEITFGFEVNEQLLTSDESSQLLEEENEGIEEASSASSKSSIKSSNHFHKMMNRSCDSSTKLDMCNSNGGILYNDVIENRNAYVNSSKGMIGEITNSTLQELFKRHETMSAPRTLGSSGIHSLGNTPANSIANKYVPPVAPIQFNHDKIVTFVGMAWEDVMKNGKIQYYTGDN